eukprot:s6059_g4.t1
MMCKYDEDDDANSRADDVMTRWRDDDDDESEDNAEADDDHDDCCDEDDPVQGDGDDDDDADGDGDDDCGDDVDSRNHTTRKMLPAWLRRSATKVAGPATLYRSVLKRARQLRDAPTTQMKRLEAQQPAPSRAGEKCPH